MASTSRKIYVEFAEMIKGHVDAAGYLPPVERAAKLDDIRQWAREVASIFAQDNPRFDRGRFLEACGL